MQGFEEKNLVLTKKCRTFAASNNKNNYQDIAGHDR